MRSETEIRKQIANLRDSATPGCQCNSCIINICCSGALAWVLGEYETDQHDEEILAMAAAKNREKRSKK